MSTRPWVMSAEVDDSDDALAEDYNHLWWDLWFGHKHGHSAADIDHGDLKEESKELAGTYLTHKKLSLHVQQDGTSTDPDSTGGSEGVHGLGAGEHVVGVRTRQLLVQSGNARANLHGPRGLRCRIYYPRPYKEQPRLLLCVYATADGPIMCWHASVDTFWSNFQPQLYPIGRTFQDDFPEWIDFHWIAWGEEGTPPKDEKKEYEDLL